MHDYDTSATVVAVEDAYIRATQCRADAARRRRKALVLESRSEDLLRRAGKALARAKKIADYCQMSNGFTGGVEGPDINARTFLHEHQGAS